MAMSASGSGDISKVKAEFQRELYKVGDSRMTNTDNQSNVIVAAAVAVVGLAAAASQDSSVNPWLFAAAGLAASFAALLALYARLETPRWPSPNEQELRRKLDDAAKAVGAVYGGGTSSIDEAYDLAFDAWYRMALSQDLRRKRKQSIYAVAVMALLLELAFVLAALLDVSG